MDIHNVSKYGCMNHMIMVKIEQKVSRLCNIKVLGELGCAYRSDRNHPLDCFQLLALQFRWMRD